jgi:hypothetical protein
VPASLSYQTEVTGTNKVSGCCVPAFFTGETVLRRSVEKPLSPPA